MTRCAVGWITNIRRGGQPEVLKPDAHIVDLALRAAASVGADYAGIDMLRDAEGQYWVLEVNSMPAWHGLQQVAESSIAERLAALLIARLQ
jgi:glutathione synthase/RimK-type ligase-like ATP-grasp enzyme